MNNLVNKETTCIPFDITFQVRADNAWKKVTTAEIFQGKKIVIFGLPGAFTPTCSSSHLPRYEELYDTFKANGVDEVYCLSVNDTFVMNEWAKAQKIEKVKMLPDGNKQFTSAVGMLVSKEDLGFGERSWRYSMLIDNGVIVKHFIEPDKEGDPFEVSDADTMLKAINASAVLPDSITLFSKDGCPFCVEAKTLLKEKGYNYAEVVLSDADRQKVLSGVTGQTRPTSPQVFMNGVLVGGLEELKQKLAA